MTHPRSDALVKEILEEFPTFRILSKRTSGLQKAIDVFLRVVTLGGMRTYLTRYHTVLFGTLWVPDTWNAMPDLDRYVLLRHERVHLRQRRRMGDLWMAFVYLVPYFPLGLAYGRARIEQEAYEETLLATAEVYGRDAALGLKEHIFQRFTGPDYGFMWPFRGSLEAWFSRAMERVDRSLSAEASRPDP
ncbi:MAG: hypothetical protein IPK71_26695 [Myxococcales bacterium]|nr:hypothetical protein [Myxococcales bacterium]